MQGKNNSKKNKKIIITGGHLTPALAVIEELQKQTRNWEIVFVGRQTSEEGINKPSQESIKIPKMGITFKSIPAGKIPRHRSFRTITAILRIPLGFISSLIIVGSERPDIVLSFGGYLAVPVCLAAKIYKIPIITHEQTAVKGLATAIIEKLASKVAVSWDQQVANHPKSKVVVTGNPVRASIIQGPGTKIALQNNKAPIIYITGGNLGSQVINRTTKKALPKLTDRYNIVHQCGMGKAGDDINILIKAKSDLPSENQAKYLVQQWFTSRQVAWLLRNSRLVISRSGANIVTELALIGPPSILIPLPISARNEQYKNAKLLEDNGYSLILDQSSLNSSLLINKVKFMIKNYQDYKKHAPQARKLVKPDAAARIIDLIEDVYKKKTN